MFEDDGLEVNMHGIYKDENMFRKGINLNLKCFIPKSVQFDREMIAETSKKKSQVAKENSEIHCTGAGDLKIKVTALMN